MDIRHCCKSGGTVFRLTRKGEPAGVSLLPFARQLFHVWTLRSAKAVFSGSDVPRRLNETSTAFCRALISTSLSFHCIFDLLIFRRLLCEPEAKSHFLAKCRLNIQGMPSWRD